MTHTQYARYEQVDAAMYKKFEEEEMPNAPDIQPHENDLLNRSLLFGDDSKTSAKFKRIKVSLARSALLSRPFGTTTRTQCDSPCSMVRASARATDKARVTSYAQQCDEQKPPATSRSSRIRFNNTCPGTSRSSNTRSSNTLFTPAYVFGDGGRCACVCVCVGV